MAREGRRELCCDTNSGGLLLVAGAGAARTCLQEEGGSLCRAMGKASQKCVFGSASAAWDVKRCWCVPVYVELRDVTLVL